MEITFLWLSLGVLFIWNVVVSIDLSLVRRAVVENQQTADLRESRHVKEQGRLREFDDELAGQIAEIENTLRDMAKKPEAKPRKRRGR